MAAPDSGVQPAPAPSGPQAWRVERDALGSVRIEDRFLWGIETARSLENLSFSGRTLGACVPYLAALGLVKRAAARANREAGVLEARLAGALDAAAARVAAGELREHFPADLLGGGGSIGVHMNVNEVLANLANESLGGRRGEYAPLQPRAHVSLSQSTADVCHSALRLAALRQGARLGGALRDTAATLRGKAVETAQLPTLARTCLRDALPTQVGVLLGGHAALLERRAGEVERALQALRGVALGGTVIGSGEGAPARYRERVVPILAELAELPLAPRASLPDALQNTDDLRALSAELALLAEALLKIAADLRLLSSGPRGGLGELLLPPVQAGSSFFAGKQNPVVLESVIQCACQVLGADRAAQAAAERAELHLNVFDGQLGANVLDAQRMLAEVIERLDARCLRGLRADEERCRALAALAHES